jgi:hypothetical protein
MEREKNKLSFKVQPNGDGFDIYQRGTNGEYKLVKENVKNMKEVMDYQSDVSGRDLNRRNFLSWITGRK